ncbi:MAG: COX15/CtaA family protein [Pseudomonadaceae bacterium]|nr:COX15/CtaA family protein [Pseudomonadaceae bacterium]
MVSQRVLNLNRLGLVLVVFVVVLGAFTRLVDAGLGCPDWPGCYGHLKWPDSVEDVERAEKLFPESPVDHAKTWPEMVHRYFAGALLLVVLALTLIAWRDNPPNRIREISTALLVLIICQAAFGAWTVTLKLWPQVVTAHLMGGFATFSLLWVLYLRQGGGRLLWLDQAQKINLKRHAQVALGLVIAQIALGGWVASNYAALACADFPTCYGSYSPPMDFASGFNIFQHVGPNYLGGLLDNEARIAIHWTHRLGALLVMVVVAALAFRLWSANRFLATLTFTLLVFQLMLGVLNVVWSLPLGIATAHNAFGALLLLAMVTVNFAPAADDAKMHARNKLQETQL